MYKVLYIVSSTICCSTDPLFVAHRKLHFVVVGKCTFGDITPALTLGNQHLVTSSVTGGGGHWGGGHWREGITGGGVTGGGGGY